LFAHHLKAGNKAMACGRTAARPADSQHFVAELVNRLRAPSRPARRVALTTDTRPDPIATTTPGSRCSEAAAPRSARRGDVLLAISTRRQFGNVLDAVQATRTSSACIVA